MAYVVVDQVFDLDIGDSTAKYVLFSLARAVNHEKYEASGDTEVWPGQETIALELGLSSRTVRKALKYLEEHGIAIPIAFPKGGPGKSTRYRLRFDHLPRRGKPDPNVEESSTLESGNEASNGHPADIQNTGHAPGEHSASTEPLRNGYANLEESSAQPGKSFRVNVEDFAPNVEEIADEPGTEPGRFNQEAEAGSVALSLTRKSDASSSSNQLQQTRGQSVTSTVYEDWNLFHTAFPSVDIRLYYAGRRAIADKLGHFTDVRMLIDGWTAEWEARAWTELTGEPQEVVQQGIEQTKALRELVRSRRGAALSPDQLAELQRAQHQIDQRRQQQRRSRTHTAAASGSQQLEGASG